MFKTAKSTATDVQAAVQEIGDQIGNLNSGLLVYFSSSNYDMRQLAAGLQDRFGDGVTLFGCSTAGEIVSNYMGTGSMVAAGISDEVCGDVAGVVIEDVHSDASYEAALANLEQQLGQKLSDLSRDEYVGLVATDGMSLGEEKVMDRLGNRTNIAIVGGSSGDDRKFEEAYVYLNGKHYSNAAALVVLKPQVKFKIVKTQSFDVTDKVLTATRVDESTRQIFEFNGKPAVAAYAEAVGVSPEQLPDYFMSNPVGLMVDGEPYVRSPQQIQGDSVIFYCRVQENMDLHVLKARDIVADTSQALEGTVSEIGSDIVGVVNFNCILRTLELENKNQTDAYAALYDKLPMVGFSTYGESYIGHINQTSTMLFFYR